MREIDNCWAENNGLYRTTHRNHPCTRWLFESEENRIWLICHAFELADEYSKRFKRKHKCEEILIKISERMFRGDLPKVNVYCAYVAERYNKHTLPPQVMPDKYRQESYIQAYRDYIQNEKSYYSNWTSPGYKPRWWKVPTKGEFVSAD
jgi:hypothetical protein